MTIECKTGIYNVWLNSDSSVTTIMAINEHAAKSAYARRYGYLPDMQGYDEFITSINTKFIKEG